MKYKRTFENTYSGTYYLVLYKGKRFALINFPSKQFKNPQDQAISRTHPQEGADFLQKLFAKRPDFLAELSLSMLESSYSYSDFKEFEPLFADEIGEILNTPYAKEGAIRDATLVVELAKRIGEWPDFEGWPEGYQKLISTSIDGKQGRAIQEFVEARGRVHEIEERMLSSGDIGEIKKYALWVGKSQPDPQSVKDLVQIGRTAALREARNPRKLRSAISWLSAEKALLGPDLAPFPELEKEILESQDSRLAFAYARIRNQPWPEAEPLIATNERAKSAYESKILGGPMNTPGQVAKRPQPTDPEGLVRQSILRGTEASEEEEDIILQDIDQALQYAIEVIGPWPELEDKLRAEGSREQKQQYSREVLYGEFQ